MATTTKSKTTEETATKKAADEVADTADRVSNIAVGDLKEVSADMEEAADRARDLNQDFIEVTKHLGNVTLDAGEKNLHTLLDFQRKAAEATQMDAVTAMTDAQIKVVSDMANVYTQTMRDFLK